MIKKVVEKIEQIEKDFGPEAIKAGAATTAIATGIAMAVAPVSTTIGLSILGSALSNDAETLKQNQPSTAEDEDLVEL